MRSYAYTMPRIAILFAFIIYAMAAKVIWEKRDQLDGYLNPLNETPFVSTITTEVKITHEERPIVQHAYPHGISEPTAENDVYAVEVEADPQKLQSHFPDALRVRSITRHAAEQAQDQEAWLYARVAFLFFLVLLITWVCIGAS
jgi:hypothetical protein